MSTWRFSDGTTVHLGGEVEGSSLFAQELREMLARDRVGVQIWPIPAEGVVLDRNDVAIMNAWLLQELNRPFRSWMMIHVTESPRDIPPLPSPPRGDEARTDLPDDLIY